MLTLFERHFSSLSSFLILVSTPVSAFSATTVLYPGQSVVAARVYDTGGPGINWQAEVIDHAVPGSASVAAAGSEVSPPPGNPPNTYSTANGTITAGLDQYVFSLHWTGAAHLTMTPPELAPFGRAYSQLCAQAFVENGCLDQLVFQVSAPTPITIAARGAVATSGYGAATSSFSLYSCSSPSSCPFTALADVITDWVTVNSLNESENFNRRFSTTLSPGFYGFLPGGYAVVNEDSISNNVTASLDIVLTLSPVGDCSDGLDNDNDTLVDLDDADCEDGTDTSEAASLPGVPALGTAGRSIVLTALLLMTLPHLRARRRT